MKISQAKKILVIRLSSLGDVLLTTPVIRSIKSSYNPISIDYLVKENFADAVRFNPYINETIIYSDSEKLIEQLEENNYDLVIDLHNNFRSQKIRKRLGVPFYKFVKPNIEKFLLVHFKINRLNPVKPIPVRYVLSIPHLDLDEKGPELFIPESFQSDLNSSENRVGLCPGAVHFTKRWPVENFADLGIRLVNNGYKIVLLGGSSDRDICKTLSNMIPNASDLSNNNNLFQTAAEMKNCKFVVCNDSGLMHTATALSIPVVSIFGSTVKEFGFYPYNSTSKVIENNNLDCRPCTHIGKKKCPKTHFKCMIELTPNIVYKEIVNFSESI